MKKKYSIINTLYQNITITIIFFISIVLIVNFMASKKLYESAVENGNVVAKSIAIHLEERMKEPERDILEIERIEIENVLSQDQTDEYLNDIVRDNPFFSAIEILNKDGKVLNSAPNEFHSVGMDRSGELFFQNNDWNGAFYWSDIFTLILNGQPTIAVTKAENDKMFVVYVNIEEISRISTDYTKYFGDQIQMFITDENGTYISNADKRMMFQRAVDDENSLVKEALTIEEGYFISKKKDVLVNVAFIENVSWYVSLQTPLEHIYAPIRNTYWLFYLFVFILLILTIIYYRKAIRIGKAINKFSVQTKKITEGNFDIEIEKQNYRELDKLGTNFTQMAIELKKRDLRLEEYAYIDTLTGLKNRRAMMEILENYVIKKVPFAIAYFDLDQFKNINDKFGHYNGDLILNQAAKRILSAIKNKGFLGRIGGDEFLFLLPFAKEEEQISVIVKKVIGNIREPFEVENNKMYLGISAGIAMYPKNTDNVTDLLKFSDMAMYSSKSKGMNGFEYFTPELHSNFDRKMEIENQLRNNINKNEFSCVFQPQVELSTETIIGFEALIRWNNQLLGEVYPSEFISVAEERELIGHLTIWMIERACEGILGIQRVYKNSFKVSVNISVIDLNDKEFPNKLIKIIKQKGIDPKMLELEITENIMINNYEEIIGALQKIKGYGVKISLDDFGKGYSSLSYLNQLPIDTLKIDREFLESSRYHQKGYKLIESIIDIGKKMNFAVIAEGVETDDQMETLKNIDCYAGQGFLICRPIPLEEVIDFVIQKQ